MPRRRDRPRDDWRRVRPCTFGVPKDADGNYILPAMRGWIERRQMVIADMEREAARLKHLHRYRKRPHPHLLPLQRAIKAWRAEIAAGVPKGDDEYGPLEIGGTNAA